MKKILILLVCLINSIIASYAQDTELTKEELKFRDAIELFLLEEGFSPTVDKEDNSLNFKKEGEDYWINVYGSSPTYIELHKTGFKMEDINRSNIMEACNKATFETRCAKAYIGLSGIDFSVEAYCYSVNDFTSIFYRAISAIDLVKKKTKNYYTELDK